MKTDELIHRLAQELEPGPRLRPAWQAALGAVGLGMALAAAGFLWMSIRVDLNRQLGWSPFMLSTLGLGLLGVLFSLALFAMATPGEGTRRGLMAGSGALLVAGVALLAGWHPEAALLGHSHGGTGCECAGIAFGLSVAPLALSFYLLRKRAPLHPAMIGAWAGLGASLLGAFALGFTCSDDRASHLLIFHLLLPSTALALVGAWLGRGWLRW